MKSLNTYRLWKWPLPLSSYLMLTALKDFTKGSVIIPMNVWETEKAATSKSVSWWRRGLGFYVPPPQHWVSSPVCHRTTLLFLEVSVGVQSSLCKTESSYDVKTRVWWNGEYEHFMCVYTCRLWSWKTRAWSAHPEPACSRIDYISTVLKPSACLAWVQGIVAWPWHHTNTLPWFPSVWCENLALAWNVPQGCTVIISLHAKRQY